jgi:hypothetical protein
MNSKSSAAGQQLPTYNPNKGLKDPLKEGPKQLSEESAADLMTAAYRSFEALSDGDKMDFLRSKLDVLCFKPRDPGLIVELAELNILLTKTLDELLLNAPADDPIIEALHKRAEREPSWPTLVRPGDEKFTRTKLAKLGVGNRIPGRLGRVKAKRPPSLATASNRQALWFYKQLERSALGATDRTPSEVRSAIAIVSLSLALGLNISKSQYERLLEILRDFKPLSKETLSWWNHALTEFVLIVDPTLERFPQVRSASAKGIKYTQTDEARFRSELEKFFLPALKNLLS